MIENLILLFQIEKDFGDRNVFPIFKFYPDKTINFNVNYLKQIH